MTIDKPVLRVLIAVGQVIHIKYKTLKDLKIITSYIGDVSSYIGNVCSAVRMNYLW